MKTKLHLVIWVFAISICITSAQTDTTLNELLTRLDQNHAGAITDVFTQHEIGLLRTHFNSEIPNTETVTSTTVFAPENVNGNFGNFETGNPGNYAIINQSGTADFEGAGTYNQFLDVFYVIDNSGNAYEINPSTGQYTPFPMVIAPPGESFTGLEFDPTTGTLYGISTNGTGTSTLSEINYETGEVTVIGDTGLVLAIALAFDIAGIAYTYDIDTDVMYRLNKTNAAATMLGSIGFDASFGQGMFLNPVTGVICLTAFNNGAFRSELRMLNTDTGATTLVGPIGSTSPGGTLQFAWSSIDKSTLGIEDSSSTDITIFPNPANQLLYVSASENIEEIVLYSMLGQELLRIKPNKINIAVAVDFLVPGAYVLSVMSNGQKLSRQFLKH